MQNPSFFCPQFGQKGHFGRIWARKCGKLYHNFPQYVYYKIWLNHGLELKKPHCYAVSLSLTSGADNRAEDRMVDGYLRFFVHNLGVRTKFVLYESNLMASDFNSSEEFAYDNDIL